MKYVRKMGAPHEYISWCNRVRGTQDEDYRRLRNPEKTSLHRALVREQGWLCAYTMRWVDENTSHIEHIKPEGLCRSEQAGSDLDYNNLLACFPREGMANKHRYGAQQKGDWWHNNGAEFVSPLHVNCEKRFRFDLDGNIHAANEHCSALKTIEVLRLDHQSLTEDRKRVIHEFVYGETRSDVMSEAQASRVIRSICEKNAKGRYYEFCVAIRDALKEHIEDLKKIANRRKFVKKK